MWIYFILKIFTQNGVITLHIILHLFFNECFMSVGVELPHSFLFLFFFLLHWVLVVACGI